MNSPLHPLTPEELAGQLARANKARTPVGTIDLSRLNRLVEHVPEDMTVTVEAGITLAALQETLAHHGQWVPVDPPFAETLTVGRLLELNASGPRRHGHGTVRDSVIGLRAVLPDGRQIHSGGRVVKNVAGFDLVKLFIGAGGSLGVITEVSFKVVPRPESERILIQECGSTSEAEACVERVLESPLTPVILDAHRPEARGPIRVVVGFAGLREAVEWEGAEALRLGFATPGDTGYDEAFFRRHPAGPPWRRSLLPSQLFATIAGLGPCPFLARVGAGLLHLAHEAGRASPPRTAHPLEHRIKELFDPCSILPPLPA